MAAAHAAAMTLTEFVCFVRSTRARSVTQGAMKPTLAPAGASPTNEKSPIPSEKVRSTSGALEKRTESRYTVGCVACGTHARPDPVRSPATEPDAAPGNFAAAARSRAAAHISDADSDPYCSRCGSILNAH